MKNKEKFKKEIVDIACNGNTIAVSKVARKPIACEKNNCANCYRCHDFLFCDKERLKEWAESEYIEKPVISKKDRAFLEYLGTVINYITRDMDGGLFIYISKPHKLIDCWESSGCETDKSLKSFKLDFPMIKWSDSEPWFIDDLKKLEVVEEYA